MNVLLLTGNVDDARVIETGLAALLQAFHLEVSPDAGDAAARLSAPCRFQALILDCALQPADALGVVRTLRSENLPVAVVGLIPGDDPASDARLMDAGADDYVLKQTGYLERLAAVLRRVCALYDPAQGSGGGPRVLYAGKAAGDAGAHPEEAAERRDATHATSLLLLKAGIPQDAPPPASGARQAGQTGEAGKTQMDALLGALKSCKESEATIQRDFSAARSRWEEQKRDLENDVKNAEEQRHRMEEAMEGLKEELNRQQRLAREEQARLNQQLVRLNTRVSRQADQLREERTRIEQLRGALKERLGKIVQTCTNFEEAARLEQARCEEQARQHAAELRQTEKRREECEDQLRRAREEAERLKDSLKAAESRITRQEEQLRAAREQWEAARQAFEQQRQTQEARLVELEETISRLALEHRERLAEAEKSRLELENTAALLAEELQRTSESHERAAQELLAARTHWESAMTEVEKRRKSLEEQLRIAYRRHQNPLKEQGGGPMQW